MFDHLETKHSLFKATVDNLKDYMARARNKVETAKMANTDLDGKVLADKFMHSDQISERLAFIRYISDSSKKIHLGADSLTILWDELVTHSPVARDAGLLYTWLRELCDRAAQLRKEPQTSANVEDLVQFYNSKLEIWMKADDEFKDLSLQGFHCIQSFFVLTNEIKGGLLRIPETYGVYNGKKPAQEPEVAAENTAGTTAGPTLTVQKDGKAATKFTSFSNTTGATYTSYSFN